MEKLYYFTFRYVPKKTFRKKAAWPWHFEVTVTNLSRVWSVRLRDGGKNETPQYWRMIHWVGTEPHHNLCFSHPLAWTANLSLSFIPKPLYDTTRTLSNPLVKHSMATEPQATQEKTNQLQISLSVLEWSTCLIEQDGLFIAFLKTWEQKKANKGQQAKYRP